MLFINKIIIIFHNRTLEHLLCQVADLAEQLAVLREELEAIIKERIIFILILLPLILDFGNLLIRHHLVNRRLELHLFFILVQSRRHWRQVPELSNNRKVVRSDSHWL